MPVFFRDTGGGQVRKKQLCKIPAINQTPTAGEVGGFFEASFFLIGTIRSLVLLFFGLPDARQMVPFRALQITAIKILYK